MAAPPTVLFVDTYPWAAFSALAGALRVRGINVARVTCEPDDRATAIVQNLDRQLYGATRRLFHRDAGGSFEISAGDLVDLVPEGTIDVQTQDALLPLIAGAPSPLTDPSHRLGPGIDPAILSDKVRLAQVAAELGIPVPRMWTEPTADSFPAVVKSPSGSGGAGVRIVSDQQQLEAAWAELQEAFNERPFMQEFHPANIIMTGGVAAYGEPIVSVAFRAAANPGDLTGPAARVVPVHSHAADDLTAELIAKLGFTGFYNADWAIDADGTPLLIDFNARVFGSWVALAECGVDFIGAYLFQLGLGPRPVQGPVAWGKTAGVLRTFTTVTSTDELRSLRRESMQIIADRQEWLGNRWARVQRQEVRLAAASARIRIRRQASPSAGTP